MRKLIDNNRVLPIDIEQEVKKSFIEYSMSVIVSRALPDVRDGLKPVHRRILYTMYEDNNTPDRPFRKSASPVGTVLARYHPHGDSAVYDALVRMAQDFSLRYPMVDGHGNFGSIDGDSAAAMRYTEARMTRLAMEMLTDIDKDTVDWRANYDDTRKEPTVLPARVPNLLINGSTGIAVGMATSIPPHNLGEIVDGCKMLLDNPEATSLDLMQVVKGPDFPTAGIIMGRQGIRNAFLTGRGSVKVRSRTSIEEKKNGRTAIIVTEIPYMVNKATLVEKIAALVRDKQVEGIVDLRDESNRHGIRVVIELRRDVNPHVILNQLYKHTQLEDTFAINLLALVKNEPKTLSLREILALFLEHRREVIRRRTAFDLKVAQHRLHIVEGLKIAIDNLDEVIALIRGSKDAAEARPRLIERFSLSEEQANAILDMRFRALTGLERFKLEEEEKELQARIADFEDILAREERVDGIISDDLDEVRHKYSDPRRTELMEDLGEVLEEDLIQDEEVVLTLTNRGYIKRQPLSNYRAQRRGGRGISATATRSEDFAREIIVTNSRSLVLFFTNRGRVFADKAYHIPESSRQAKGTPAVNFLQLTPGETVTNIIPINNFRDDRYLMFTSRFGVVKKSSTSSFSNIRKSGIIAIGLRDGDELIGVKKVEPEDRIVMTTAHGQVIMFDESEVRAMGRTATGVKGINLGPSDAVISVDKALETADLLIISEKGFGKRIALTEFREQKRGGKGLKAINLNSNRSGLLVAAKVVNETDEFVVLTESGVVMRGKVNEVSRQKRQARGVTVIRINEEDKAASLARFKPEDEDGLESAEIITD
ncbi:MAG: DNA gyrase subunit A [Methylocystaceae bacterium]